MEVSKQLIQYLLILILCTDVYIREIQAESVTPDEAKLLRDEVITLISYILYIYNFVVARF